MAEEKRTPQTIDPRLLLQLHRANYEIFRVRSIEGINRAIENALKMSPFVTIYYTMEAGRLQLVNAFDPKSSKIPAEILKQVEIPLAEIKEKYAWGNVLDDLQESNMTPALVDMLKSIDCTRAAFLPLVEASELVGLFLIGAREYQTLDSAAIGTLISLAELVPFAFDKIKALSSLQQRVQDLEKISAASEAVSKANDINSLCQIIHQHVRDVFGELSLTIAFYDAKNNTIQIPYSFDQSGRHTLEPTPLGENLISTIIRTQQPLMLVEDAVNKAHALGADIVGLTAKSWLGCPMMTDGNVFGAIILQDPKQEHRFSESDLRYITALLSRIAKAINDTRLLEKSRAHAAQIQTIADILHEISSSLAIDDILSKAATLIRDRLEFFQVAIYLTEGDHAVVREATSEWGMRLKRSGYKLKIGSDSIIGIVTENGKTLVVNETTNNPIFTQNPHLNETRAELALPLKVGDRLLGAIDIQSVHPFSFLEEDVADFEILAGQLAIAIMNSEAFAEAEERLAQHRLLHHVITAAASSTTIEDSLNSAVQGLQVTLGGDQIAILLVNHELNVLEVKSAIGYPNQDVTQLHVPMDSGITGWVASHREPLRIDDVTKDSRYIAISERVRSELAIPLIYRNEVVGVLNIESTRIGAFDEEDEEMLSTLGGSLAAVIAHSSLLEQFRRQAERERLLYEVTNRIRRSTNIQTILSTTASEVAKITNTRQIQIKVDLGAVSPFTGEKPIDLASED
jgi:GAF domain-containing protein